MAAEATTQEVVEKQTNCLSCGKPLKKLKKYYRNGKFYCTKKCWRTFLEKSKEKKE
jgi:transposase-like protein